jgi:hypothetical protein
MTMTELLLHIKKMCSSVYIKKNVDIVPIVCALKVEDECEHRLPSLFKHVVLSNNVLRWEMI